MHLVDVQGEPLQAGEEVEQGVGVVTQPDLDRGHGSRPDGMRFRDDQLEQVGHVSAELQAGHDREAERSQFVGRDDLDVADVESGAPQPFEDPKEGGSVNHRATENQVGAIPRFT